MPGRGWWSRSLKKTVPSSPSSGSGSGVTAGSAGSERRIPQGLQPFGGGLGVLSGHPRHRPRASRTPTAARGAAPGAPNPRLAEKVRREVGGWTSPHEETVAANRCGSLAHRRVSLGTSLVVQWLRLQAPSAGGTVRSLVGELRSRMPCDALIFNSTQSYLTQTGRSTL